MTAKQARQIADNFQTKHSQIRAIDADITYAAQRGKYHIVQGSHELLDNVIKHYTNSGFIIEDLMISWRSK